jgi:hypothetical protein
MLLYAMMVMMREERINTARPKAIISVDLVSEQERWVRGPISQKKWGMTWASQKDKWETFTSRLVMRMKLVAQQAVTRRRQVLRFMMLG